MKDRFEQVLLNQSAIFFPPFISHLISVKCGTILESRLRYFIPEIQICLEARILLTDSKFIPNCAPYRIQEVLLNFLRSRTFPSSICDVSKSFDREIDSFDLPDIIYRFEKNRDPKSFNGKILLKLISFIWRYISVDNLGQLNSSVEEIFRVTNAKNVFLHTSSKELVKIIKTPSIITDWANRLADQDKSLYLGVEIDHSEHTVLEWLELVARVNRDYKYLSNFQLGIDLDFFHIHESFLKGYMYLDDPNFDIKTWEYLFRQIVDKGIQIIDFHLHDGNTDGKSYTLAGDLYLNWEDIFDLAKRFEIFPIHRNLELNPNVLLKVLFSYKEAERLANMLKLSF